MKTCYLILLCLAYSNITSAAASEIGPLAPDFRSTTPLKPATSSKAQTAMQRGDYAIAYHIWKPLADAGDTNAIFNLGWMYRNGYGLRIDNLKAKELWEEAATSGHADAAFSLALLLNMGDKQVKQDIPLAVYYFQTAAFKGHMDARAMLIKLFQQHPEKLQTLVKKWTKTEWRLISKPGKIKAEKANIRDMPSIKGKIVYVMKKGQPLLSFNQRSDWLQVYLPLKKITAWVHQSLVSFDNTNKQAQLLRR